jgi:hypothetical protein
MQHRHHSAPDFARGTGHQHIHIPATTISVCADRVPRGPSQHRRAIIMANEVNGVDGWISTVPATCPIGQ